MPYIRPPEKIAKMKQRLCQRIFLLSPANGVQICELFRAEWDQDLVSLELLHRRFSLRSH
jgi:hypothetical protein